jgi:hypothetical protein
LPKESFFMQQFYISAKKILTALVLTMLVVLAQGQFAYASSPAYLTKQPFHAYHEQLDAELYQPARALLRAASRDLELFRQGNPHGYEDAYKEFYEQLTLQPFGKTWSQASMPDSADSREMARINRARVLVQDRLSKVLPSKLYSAIQSFKQGRDGASVQFVIAMLDYFDEHIVCALRANSDSFKEYCDDDVRLELFMMFEALFNKIAGYSIVASEELAGLAIQAIIKARRKQSLGLLALCFGVDIEDEDETFLARASSISFQSVSPSVSPFALASSPMKVGSPVPRSCLRSPTSPIKKLRWNIEGNETREFCLDPDEDGSDEEEDDLGAMLATDVSRVSGEEGLLDPGFQVCVESGSDESDGEESSSGGSGHDGEDDYDDEGFVSCEDEDYSDEFDSDNDAAA